MASSVTKWRDGVKRRRIGVLDILSQLLASFCYEVGVPYRFRHESGLRGPVPVEKTNPQAAADLGRADAVWALRPFSRRLMMKDDDDLDTIPDEPKTGRERLAEELADNDNNKRRSGSEARFEGFSQRRQNFLDLHGNGGAGGPGGPRPNTRSADPSRPTT
jgi:hypothetical protein